MEKLSVYIITYNEERRLPATLEAASRVADEIVVVDSGSSDNTEGIARRYKARFIYHKWTSYGEQVKIAQDHCTYNWVLRLDADEVLSDELIEEIRQIKENPIYDGYKLRIGDVYPGIPKPIKWAKHYQLIRLYRRDKFSMQGMLDHDDVDLLVPHARAKLLNGFVLHYSYESLARTINKQNFATDNQIRIIERSNRKYGAVRMLGCSTLTFLKYYILYRHFLYGWWGFINCVNIAYFRFMKFAKWYEHEMQEKLL